MSYLWLTPFQTCQQWFPPTSLVSLSWEIEEIHCVKDYIHWLWTKALLVSSSHRSRIVYSVYLLPVWLQGSQLQLSSSFSSSNEVSQPLSVSAQGSCSTILNISLVFLHTSLNSATAFLICEDKIAHNTQDMRTSVFRCPAVLLFRALSPSKSSINFSKLA